jgi:hypothetical protein
MSRNKNVTFIDDLVELEELEPADMSRYGGSAVRTMQRGPEVSNFSNFQQHMQPQMQPQYQAQYQPQMQPQYQQLQTEPRSNCLEVADHIANCPICSKLYNNDKTMYIIAIVILSIIVILLLKKVLEL